MSYIEAPKPDGSLIGKITRKIKDRLPSRINQEQEIQNLGYQVVRKTFQDIKNDGWVGIFDIRPYIADEETYHLKLKSSEQKYDVFLHVELNKGTPDYFILGMSDDLTNGGMERYFAFGGDIHDLTHAQKLDEALFYFVAQKVDPTSHTASSGECMKTNEKIKFLQEILFATVDREATELDHDKQKAQGVEIVLWARERFSLRLS